MTEPRSRKDVILSKKPIVAICYDFDKALSPDDMQAFTFIPSIGMDKQAFWDESNALAKDNRMDKNLAWMHLMLKKSDANNLPVSYKRTGYSNLLPRTAKRMGDQGESI